MRIAILVIDSFGIGELPDAGQYGDEGSNTALHICRRIEGEKWPTLRRFGLGNASLLLGNSLPGCEAVAHPEASWGVMAERSPGKDTTTGHWEIAGIILDTPFHVFPAGPPSFPAELLDAFVRRIGRGVLGNRAASGTQIIAELGEEHLRTGKPIVYTSGDSVFQIAAHEEVIPVDELYRICTVVRELCDPYQVGRVIARPFEGGPGSFVRTNRRRDFSIALPGQTMLDHLSGQGVRTIAVGKIGDIFNEQGIAESHHDKGNRACLDRTLALLERASSGPELIFVNLVDTDMIYGHRRDVEGYYRAVAEIDSALPAVVGAMEEGDLLLLTADHGCDPTFRGTDHTREHVPLLAFRKGGRGAELGIRTGFSDIAATVEELFGNTPQTSGVSFRDKL